jgi:hypothetical protein
MNHDEHEPLRRALRAAVPPFDARGPARDLWPLLRGRLETPPVVVSRLDWALLAALLTSIVLFPESLLTLLYHL